VDYYANKHNHRQVLQMLGQVVDPRSEQNTAPEHERGIRLGAAFPAYQQIELRIDRGKSRRVDVWWPRVDNQPPAPARPPFLAPKPESEWAQRAAQDRRAGRRKLALLFPFSEYSVRTWPMAYWLDLAWGLEAEGVSTAAFYPSGRGDGGLGFPFAYWGHSWRQIAAWMQHADLVIGNDSGPTHLAATIGTPTLGIMGPTSNIFTHAENARELRVTADQVSCVGCHFAGERGYRKACDYQCRALLMLDPGEVLSQCVNAMDTLPNLAVREVARA
jgi:hypothetical protein